MSQKGSFLRHEGTCIQQNLMPIHPVRYHPDFVPMLGYFNDVSIALLAEVVN